MKLSKRQAELLAAMETGVVCYYMRSMVRFNPTAYYFRSDTMKRCTATAKALFDKGLLTSKVDDKSSDHFLVARTRKDAAK